MTIQRSVRLRTRLLVLLIAPILGITYFSVTGIVERARLVREHGELQTQADLAVRVSSLVHETQKERGATSGFLGASGGAFADRLTEQRTFTDQRSRELLDFLDAVAIDNPRLSAALARPISTLERMPSIRSRVDRLEIATAEAIAYYTDMNTAFLDAISTMASVSSSGEIVSMTTAYVSFLMGKERMGIERAVLSNTFAADNFGDGMLARFTELMAAQGAYLDLFANLAPPSQVDFYELTLNAPATREVTRMEEIARTRGALGGFGVDATYWFDTMTEKIDLMKVVEDRLSADLRDTSAAIAAASQRQLLFYALSTVAVVLLTIAIAVAFVRGILRQLGAEPHEMVAIAERVSEGDLTMASGNREDATGVYRSLLNLVESLAEKGATLERIAARDLSVVVTLASDRDGLGASILQMRDALNQVLTEVYETATQVSAGSDQVAQAGTHLSEGATDQASSLQQIAASVHEIGGRSRSNADGAAQASTVAREAADSAKEGDAAMNELREAMASISASSEEIANVVKVIDDIAFQINLIALNANVEAARAGKYGRGFAVVAEEVRNLAGRSAEAVLETRAKVERAVASAADGSRVTDRTRERFLAILKGTTSVATMLEEMASASRQELTAIEQITEALDQVDRVTQSNTASAEESASASDELSKQARQLEQMVGRFTLSSASGSAGKVAPSPRQT